MNELLLAHGGLAAASGTFFVFLPFLSLGFGLFFIVFALKDKKKSDEYVRRLPHPKDQPLRHVHAALVSHKRARSAPADKPDRQPKPRMIGGQPSRRLRRVR